MDQLKVFLIDVIGVYKLKIKGRDMYRRTAYI